jgi:hypothetical protein
MLPHRPWQLLHPARSCPLFVNLGYFSIYHTWPHLSSIPLNPQARFLKSVSSSILPRYVFLSRSSLLRPQGFQIPPDQTARGGILPHPTSLSTWQGNGRS